MLIVLLALSRKLGDLPEASCGAPLSEFCRDPIPFDGLGKARCNAGDETDREIGRIIAPREAFCAGAVARLCEVLEQQSCGPDVAVGEQGLSALQQGTDLLPAHLEIACRHRKSAFGMGHPGIG